MRIFLLIVVIPLFGIVRGQDSLLRLKHNWVQNYMNEIVFCYQEYDIDNHKSFRVPPDSICSLLLQDSLKSKYINISDNIALFNNVIELEITGKGVLRMSNHIGFLTKLRCLEIEGSIDDLSIPDSLKFCENLEIIDLSGERNTITKIPEGVLGLKKLKFLTINMEGITDKKLINDITRLAKSPSITAIILNNSDLKKSDRRKLIATRKIAFLD